MSIIRLLGIAAFAAVGSFFLYLLLHRKKYFPADTGDFTYFSGHPSVDGAKSGYLSVDGGRVAFGSPGAKPFFTLPAESVTGAAVERHVGGLLGFMHMGPEGSLGATHFLRIDYSDGGAQRSLKFASRTTQERAHRVKEELLRASGGGA